MSHQIHKNTKCRNFLKGVALVFLLLLGWYPQRAHAQSAKEYNINDIFEALAQKGNGTGHIELSQPDDIKRLVGSTTQKQTSHGEGRGRARAQHAVSKAIVYKPIREIWPSPSKRLTVVLK